MKNRLSLHFEAWPALLGVTVASLLFAILLTVRSAAAHTPAEVAGGEAPTAERDSERTPLERMLSDQTAQERPASDSAASAQPPSERYRIEAVHVDEGPVINAVLDDDVWRSAAVVEDFIQQEPFEGSAASERTEVRVLYDDANLYLAVRAYDSNPEEVVATEMRRDADRILEEDNFQVILDTYQDSRSAYMFVVSPLGAKLDQQVFDEGGRGRSRWSSNSAVNRNWDGVWSVAAQQTADGWVAEIAIPMVTLRFPEREPQSWGINFMRNIRRKNEQVYWAPIPRAYELTRVSLAGSLNNLQSLSRGSDLRITPYVTGGGRRESLGAEADNSAQGDLGVDLKYGLTASLNLDVTVNTDFAQAEIDDEQVNLTRFPLFFPEKRDFFLENAGQFAVGTTTSVGRIADLFFSRRIGLTETGENVPILGGARLTGKIGSNNIAVMDIQTDDAFGQPGENFLVARYSRDVLDRSQIGGLFINKQASGDEYNRTYAADMMLSLTPALTVNGFIARTSSPGISDQEHGAHVRAGWLDRSWRIYAEHTDLGDNFNPEVGFVPRVGIRRSKLHFEYNPRPGKWGIRMMEPMANVTYYTDQTGRLVSRQFHYMVGTRLESGAYINVMYNRFFERLHEPFRVAQDVTINPGSYRFGEWTFSFSSDPSRRISYELRYSPQTFYDGDRTDMSASADVRVTDQIAAGASFSRNDVSLPAGEFTADLASLRLDMAFTPEISLRTLTQYNSSTEQWSSSARFRWIYRPGSDLYVVYDEMRRNQAIPDSPFTEEFRDHQLIVKMTYLVSL